MQRGSTAAVEENILIVTKTYPAPSRKYVETTCVAAISEVGELRRVYPVPYRLLEQNQQFKRWQWVKARLYSSPLDHRQESRRIDVDSIQLGPLVNTKNNWAERLRWIEPHIFPSFHLLEERRQQTGATLGFLKPSRLIKLEITPLPTSERNWSIEELRKLSSDMENGDLFGNSNKSTRKVLEKIPYHFHYHYEIETDQGIETLRHLITDWEVGMLYRNCIRKGSGSHAVALSRNRLMQ